MPDVFAAHSSVVLGPPLSPSHSGRVHVSAASAPEKNSDVQRDEGEKAEHQRFALIRHVTVVVVSVMAIPDVKQMRKVSVAVTR